MLVSEFSDQVTSFIDDGPHLLDKLLKHAWIRHLNDKYHFITNLQDRLKDPDLSSDSCATSSVTASTRCRAALSVVVVVVLTLYFLAALPQLKRALYSLAPASRRSRVGQLGDEIIRRTGRFVIGSVLVALIAGTVTLILLLSVGLGQYALPLALFVALLDLVPLVGSVTGATVVTIICLANSLDTGIVAAAFYLIYEPLEGYVIYPRVMRSSVDVPEYVTVIAVLAGGTLGGIIGALLALPIAAGAAAARPRGLGAPAGRPAELARLDQLDGVGDRVEHAPGPEREAADLLGLGRSGQDEDGVEAGLDAGDHVGVHAVADHHRRSRNGRGCGSSRCETSSGSACRRSTARPRWPW